MKTKMILFVALTIALCSKLNAQLQFTSYFSNQFVQSLLEVDNNIWIGTRGGLYIRNKSTGALVLVYNSNNGLTNSNVYDMAADALGNIWIATYGGGIDKFDGTTFTNFNSSNSGLTTDYVTDIIVDLDGNKWLGTPDGAFLYNDSKWTRFTTSNGMLSNNIVDMIVDTEGNIWFAFSSGISQYNKRTNKWVSYTTAQGLPTNNIVGFAVDPISGNIYIAGGSGQFASFNGTSWTTLPVGAPAFYSITVDVAGNVWAGTNGGVSMYNGSSWSVIASFGGVNTILIDALGNKWTGTTSILKRYNGSVWIDFPISKGLSSNIVFDVEIDNTGKIWLGTYLGGVSCYDPTLDTWTNHFPGSTTYKLLFDTRRNVLWAARFGDGVSKYNGSLWTNYTVANTAGGIIDDYPQAAALDSAGNLWFGATVGVSKFDGVATWTKYTVASTTGGLSDNYIYDIEVDASGNVWFATNAGGVSRYNVANSTWTKYAYPTISDNSVRDIHIAKDGRIWLATSSGGASVYNGSSWTNYTKYNSGLPENNLYSVCSDNYGNIWFGTQNKGVSKFDGANWSVYNVFNGLANNQVNSIAIDKNNVKWFATSSGVSQASCVFPVTDFASDSACFPAQSTLTNHTTNTDLTTKYEWDILNNNSIEYFTKNANHTFASFGNYQVKLNAINDNCSKSILKNVKVNSMPDISILPAKTNAICDGDNIQISAQIKNFSNTLTYKYQWSDGTNKPTINTSAEGKYAVEVSNENCKKTSDTAMVQVIYPFDKSKICIVTIDSATGKNKIIWEKDDNKNIKSYNVYKVFGTLYQPIGNIVINDFTVFKDPTSMPEVMVDRYAISAIDSCGNESTKSPYHQTMLLQAAKGTAPNEAVLSWNKYIDESGNWIPEYYYIYKGKSKSSMSLIGSVSGLLETRYNDQSFDGLSAYYQIVIKKIAPCDPAGLLKAESGPYTQSLSNIVEYKTTSLNESNALKAAAYPNPFVDDINLSFSLTNAGDVSIEIINSNGIKTATIIKNNLEAGNQIITINTLQYNLSSGIYVVKIVSEGKVSMLKVFRTK